MIDESSIPQVPVSLPERCICGHKYHNHSHHVGRCLRSDCGCSKFRTSETVRIVVQGIEPHWFEQIGSSCGCGATDYDTCSCGFVNVHVIEVIL